MNSTINNIFDKLNIMGLYPIYKSIECRTVVYRDSSKANILYEVIEDDDDKYAIIQNGAIVGDNMIDTQVIQFIENDVQLNGIKLKQEYPSEPFSVVKRMATYTARANDTPKTVTKKRNISLEDLDEE